MDALRFRTPVFLMVEGSIREMPGVQEALQFLEQWPAHRRGPVHGCAVNACRAGLGGGMTVDEARRAFESFARITGLLARGTRSQPILPARPGGPAPLPATG